MADTTKDMNSNREQDSSKTGNQTMQHERAKASVGGERSQQSGERSQQGSESSRQEKSAIGGGEDRSNTGEPGRARSELDQNKNRAETEQGKAFDKDQSKTGQSETGQSKTGQSETGQSKPFDKSRGETTGQQR